jgi:hypothetical protein
MRVQVVVVYVVSEGGIDYSFKGSAGDFGLMVAEKPCSMLICCSQVQCTEENVPCEIKGIPKLILVDTQADDVLPQVLYADREAVEFCEIARSMLTKEGRELVECVGRLQDVEDGLVREILDGG